MPRLAAGPRPAWAPASGRPTTRPAAGRRSRRLVECRQAEKAAAGAGSSVQPKAPPRAAGGLLQLAVSGATEALRLAGVGAAAAAPAEAAAAPLRPLRRGDVCGVLAALRSDYRRAYFVTGVLCDRVYAPDCLFADPTISFSGRDLWKRNLVLLTPFFVQPSIQLRSLRVTARRGARAPATVLRAEWRLTTGLRLPWRPAVDVEGATDYTLNKEDNLIVSHVETWELGAWAAVRQLLTPGPSAAEGR